MRHLRIYRAIRLIQRSGSIRKAAELLAISPSALNRSVQRFEEELGLPVFDRLPGGVRLTTAGELLCQVIDRHLSEVDAFQSQLRDIRTGLRGVLRIGVGTDLGAGLVPGLIEDFAARHPRVSIDLVSSDSLDTLRQRQVDLAVVSAPVTDDSVEVLFSYPVPLGAWLTRGEGEMPEASSVEDIAHRRWVVPPPESGTRTKVSHFLRRHRLAEPTISSLPAALVVTAAQPANTVCILPRICLTGAAAPQGLVPAAIDMGSVPVSVVRRSREPIVRPAEALVNRLEEALDGASLQPAPGDPDISARNRSSFSPAPPEPS
ncbi:MAG: LysR family transcriptional regulator [Roseicyclus sp.]